MWHPALLLLVVSAIQPIHSERPSAPWHAPWMPGRDDLRCYTSPDYHLKTQQDIDDDCRCNHFSTFHDNSQPLYIEITSITRTNLVLNASVFDNGTFYHIEYSGKHLKEFPSNLCTSNVIKNSVPSQFSKIKPFLDNIVKIDFSNNKIQEMIDLNCLTRLDILNLSYNHITTVSNTSFNSLRYLRELYLQNNLIKHMDPSLVSASQLSLQQVDLGHNLLDELDITNMESQQPFCLINYESNNLHSLVNELKLTLDPDRYSEPPGRVGLDYNSFHTFPDFKTLLNLRSLSDLGAALKFQFSVSEIPITCDCNLAPFMGLARNEIASLWTGYDRIMCHAPPNMKNVSVKDFVNNTYYLDMLTCDLTNKNITPPCPNKCLCIDQPSQNRLLINCSGQGLTKMPDKLPNSKFSSTVNLDLSGNEITSLTKVSYLPNITHISLAQNNLQHIDKAAAYLLSNASVIDLGDNPHLDKLPSELQYRKNGTIILANNTLDCDCGSTWIQNWTQNSRSSFLCRVPGHGVMPPGNFSKALLDCDKTRDKLIVLSILLGIVALTLILVGLVSYWLRYEIFILLVRAKQVKNNAILPMLHYDAYLSFDKENDDLRIWTHKILVPQLEKMGYKLFVPLRDLQYGDVRQLNTINILLKTRNFLLILSESYISHHHDTNWQNQEWQFGWNMFKASRMKNIVMINYDQILSSEVRHPQIRAYLRVGNPVDFTNTKRDILQLICQRLGPPHSTTKHADRTRRADQQVDKLFFTDTARQEHEKQVQEHIEQRLEFNIQSNKDDKHREDVDKRGFKHGMLDAKDGNINIEYLDNMEYDNYSGVEDLANQRQKPYKEQFKKPDGSGTKNRFNRELTIGSDIVLHKEDEHENRPELEFSNGCTLVTERPRPAKGTYNYYV